MVYTSNWEIGCSEWQKYVKKTKIHEKFTAINVTRKTCVSFE